MSKKRTEPVPYVQPYRYASPNILMAAIRRFARQIAERFHPRLATTRHFRPTTTGRATTK